MFTGRNFHLFGLLIYLNIRFWNLTWYLGTQGKFHGLPTFTSPQKRGEVRRRKIFNYVCNYVCKHSELLWFISFALQTVG
jgi:hypothetical protein